MPETPNCEALFSRNSAAFRCGSYVDIVGVTGSIPVTPTIRSITYGANTKFPTGSSNLLRAG
jgi:hypothetical protein